MSEKDISLYIHIPFCKERCDYCDFLSFSGMGVDVQSVYIDALIKEIDMYRNLIDGPVTIYIGGGTPSFLPVKLLRKLFNHLSSLIVGENLKEFTVEVNPESLVRDKLNVMIDAGVNRISIGVQSFSDRALKSVNRITRMRDINRALELINSRSGVKNYSIDLIIGIQSRGELEKDLEYILMLRPPHVSVYLLHISPGTPLYKSIKNRKFIPPCDEEISDMYLFACEKLENANYEHYEISNFAINGFRSMHNCRYWDYGDYIGVGAGAVSKLGSKRWENIRSLKDYIDTVRHGRRPVSLEEMLTEAIQVREKIMLSLRRKFGVDYDILARHVLKDREEFKNYVKFLIEHGYAVKENNRLRLTDRGFLVSNEIIAEIFDYIEAGTSLNA